MAQYYKNKVTIVGCGPGLKAYIPPKALYNVKKADILVGSRRLLNLFPDSVARKVVLEKNYHALINKIEDWCSTKHVVVLVSGDPGFFSYTKMIVEKMGRDACDVIPGISSMQLAFAAIGENWDDACFVSLHGRDTGYERLFRMARAFDTIGIVTDQKNTPAAISRFLLNKGIQDRKMFICENLSLPEERIREVTLSSAAHVKTNGATVVIIKKKFGYNS